MMLRVWAQKSTRGTAGRQGAGPRRVAAGLAAALLLLGVAGPAFAAEDTSRIREKCVELWSKVQAAEYAAAGEGKEQDLLRVYKDFDYLLKPSKTEALGEALSEAKDPAERDRMSRLHDYLLAERVAYAVGPNIDNMARMARNSATKIGGLSLTLRSYPSVLPNEADRAVRRNSYLATRDLLDNYNVFLMNHQIDLDTRTREICGGATAAEFMLRRLEYDPVVVDSLAARVLRATAEEYAALLARVAPPEVGGLPLKDLRAYDVPRVLRFATLDGSFPKAKESDIAAAWLRGLGIDVGGQRYFRQSLDPLEGKSPFPEVFPVANERDTRLSLVRIGGLPDYLGYFAALGEAQFHLHIDPSLPFEDRYLGSPVTARTYGLLLQGVLRDAAWREQHLKVQAEQSAMVGDALRFHQLYELRRAAGRHLFQKERRADSKIGGDRFQKAMESALGFSHTASEQSGYLVAEDYGQSGVYLVASVLAEQLRAKLAADFGAGWYAKPEAGKWLKEQWAKGYRARVSDLPSAWGLTGFDPGALLADSSPAVAPPDAAPAAGEAEAAPATGE